MYSWEPRTNRDLCMTRPKMLARFESPFFKRFRRRAINSTLKSRHGLRKGTLKRGDSNPIIPTWCKWQADTQKTKKETSPSYHSKIFVSISDFKMFSLFKEKISTVVEKYKLAMERVFFCFFFLFLNTLSWLVCVRWPKTSAQPFFGGMISPLLLSFLTPTTKYN